MLPTLGSASWIYIGNYDSVDFNGGKNTDLKLEFTAHAGIFNACSSQDGMVTFRFKAGNTSTYQFRGNAQAYYIGKKCTPQEFRVSVNPSALNIYQIYAYFPDNFDGSSITIYGNNFSYYGQVA